MIYIDMDGVLCDWVGGVLKLFNRENVDYNDIPYKVHDYLGVTADELWYRINDAGPAFWENLDDTPELVEIITTANKHGPWVILTSCGWCAPGAMGKVLWLKRHFGNEFQRFVITSHKHLLARSSQDILIDDQNNNLDPWRAAGGRAIPIHRPWTGSPKQYGPLDSLRAWDEE